MKSVLIRIRSEWCWKIASGRKTIEVRKTRPKLDTPFKCYIYCPCSNPKWKSLFWLDKAHNENANTYGKVIGEFVCDEILNYEAEFVNDDCQNSIRKFEFDEEYDERDYSFETSNEVDNPDDCKLCKNSCLSFNKIKQYISKGKEGFFDFFAWHISDLVIYDELKELSEFIKIGDCDAGTKCKQCPYSERGVEAAGLEDDCIAPFDTSCYSPIIRPPQSWCYVEGEVTGNDR